jgi:hypothetical protein
LCRSLTHRLTPWIIHSSHAHLISSLYTGATISGRFNGYGTLRMYGTVNIRPAHQLQLITATIDQIYGSFALAAGNTSLVMNTGLVINVYLASAYRPICDVANTGNLLNAAKLLTRSFAVRYSASPFSRLITFV